MQQPEKPNRQNALTPEVVAEAPVALLAHLRETGDAEAGRMLARLVNKADYVATYRAQQQAGERS